MEKTDRQEIANQLRGELLDEKSAALNRWLAFIAIVLTIIGLGFPLLGYIGIGYYQDLLDVMNEDAAELAGLMEEAQEHLEKIREVRVAAEGKEGQAPQETEILEAFGRSATVTTSGELGDGSRDSFEFDLHESGSYLFVGSCGNNCSDLDLRLWQILASGDRAASPLEQDELLNAAPIIFYASEDSLKVAVEVIMYECAATTCDWQVEIYSVIDTS